MAEAAVLVLSFHYRHSEGDILTTGPTASPDLSTSQNVLKDTLSPFQVPLLHPYHALLFCRNWCWNGSWLRSRLWPWGLLQMMRYSRDLLQPLCLIFIAAPPLHLDCQYPQDDEIYRWRELMAYKSTHPSRVFCQPELEIYDTSDQHKRYGKQPLQMASDQQSNHMYISHYKEWQATKRCV